MTKEQVIFWLLFLRFNPDNNVLPNEVIDIAIGAIVAQPERRKGEWTATYSDCGGDVWVSWKCSNCGYVRKKGWEHTDAGEKPDALFCEICGADMRGKQE